MPEGMKAELIEGVVSMAPSLSVDHGEPHFDLIGWLYLYRVLTQGVAGADNASIRFDDRNMPQPDVLLRILESHGGRCRVSADRCLEGGPELVAEVSATTTAHDLGIKRDLYRRFGVQEYIVWRVADRAVDWFALHEGCYFPLDPRPDGVIQSQVFPGLWLHPAALVAGDMAQLLRTAQEGHGTPEHSEFIRELQRRANAG
jgi:Uma2 family endonuclease